MKELLSWSGRCGRFQILLVFHFVLASLPSGLQGSVSDLGMILGLLVQSELALLG